MRQVDLHDVDEALFDERPDVLDRMRALTGRDRKPRRAAARASFASGFSGGTGSSIHSGPNGSSAPRHAPPSTA